jgi:hypothetical protein
MNFIVEFGVCARYRADAQLHYSGLGVFSRYDVVRALDAVR